MIDKRFAVGLVFSLGCAGAMADAAPAGHVMCQDDQTKLVRAYKRCPAGAYEVFPLMRSGGGGHWSKDGYWIGQVVPRVDRSKPRARSAANEKALQNILDSTPSMPLSR